MNARCSLLLVGCLALASETSVPLSAQNTNPPNTSGLRSVNSAKAAIPSNNPDGYKFGPIRKGDVITLKYIEGRWKDHGQLASENPDDPRTEEVNRLVIAMPSQGGKPGDILVVVPPDTERKESFAFTAPNDAAQIVLRIASNSDKKGNPGTVTYQLRVLR